MVIDTMYKRFIQVEQQGALLMLLLGLGCRLNVAQLLLPLCKVVNTLFTCGFRAFFGYRASRLGVNGRTRDRLVDARDLAYGLLVGVRRQI